MDTVARNWKRYHWLTLDDCSSRHFVSNVCTISQTYHLTCLLLNEMCAILTCQDIIISHPDCNMRILHFARSHYPRNKNISIEENVNWWYVDSILKQSPCKYPDVLNKSKYEFSIMIEPYLGYGGSTPWDKAIFMIRLLQVFIYKARVWSNQH